MGAGVLRGEDRRGETLVVGAAGVFGADVVDGPEVTVNEGAFDTFVAQRRAVDPGVDGVGGEPVAVDAKRLRAGVAISARIEWFTKPQKGFTTDPRHAGVRQGTKAARRRSGAIVGVGGRGDRTGGGRVVVGGRR